MKREIEISVRDPEISGARIYGLFSLGPVGLGEMRFYLATCGGERLYFGPNLDLALSSSEDIESLDIETRLIPMKFRGLTAGEALAAFDKSKKGKGRIWAVAAKNLPEERIYSKFEDIFEKERYASGAKSQKDLLKHNAFSDLTEGLATICSESVFSDLSLDDMKADISSRFDGYSRRAPSFGSLESILGDDDRARALWETAVRCALCDLLAERYAAWRVRIK